MSKMPTSCSDNETYPQFCQNAVENPAIFASFRSHPAYKHVVETCGRNTGENYKQLALSKQPGLARYYDRFVSSENIGGPKRVEYQVGDQTYLMSPTTQRYINVLADLMTYFGSLDNLKIVEVGGGYGGLAKIVSDVFTVKRYTLVDLPAATRLTKKFLSCFPMKNMEFVSSDRIDRNFEDVDIFISNYAFSELARDVQDAYCTKFVREAKCGYMLCNFSTHTWQDAQYSEPELINLIPNLNVVKTSPPLAQIDAGCSVSLLWWSS